jgi:hypothetical protein
MKSLERVIVILAHPDDEVFCQHILTQFRDYNLTFIYLTNGSPTNDLELVRTREDEFRISIALIDEAAEILPYGPMMEITDGKLAKQFSKTDLDRLIEFIGLGTKPSVFVSPTLEGGHQDHDATFIITQNLSRYWRATHYTFPLYSSSRFSFPFFRTMKKANGYIKFEQSLKTRLLFLITTLKLIRIYGSQRKAWLGLAVPVLFKFVFASPIIFINQCKEIGEIENFLYESRRNESRLTLQRFQNEIFREL